MAFSQLKHDAVSKLVFELSKLPGIGEKTATRLAYFIIRQPQEYANALSSAVLHVKSKIVLCGECLTFTDVDPCHICSDENRDQSTICIVEKPSDVMSIERATPNKSLYHVLHGVLSPLDGVGPEDLKIRELLQRLEKPGKASVKEIIIATNPSVEGDSTAMYLSRLIKPLGIRVTKLAHGIPVGGHLEYSDSQTISRALENRLEIS